VQRTAVRSFNSNEITNNGYECKMSANAILASDQAVNMARQALYRFTALALADPRTGAWDRLHRTRQYRLLSDAATLIRNLVFAHACKLAPGERPLEFLNPDPVFEQLPASAQALNAQYEATFGLVVSSKCPPYESEYIESKFAFQRSNALADISGFYRAFGLVIADQCPERPDYIVLELEFMASLLGLEREAANSEMGRRDERLEVCRAAQHRFLGDHLAWWAPAFAKLLTQASNGGYYKALAEFLAALIAAERAMLHVEADRTPMPPATEQPSDACEGCELAT
jgi:TorA maturation chaperone TorD